MRPKPKRRSSVFSCLWFGVMGFGHRGLKIEKLVNVGLWPKNEVCEHLAVRSEIGLEAVLGVELLDVIDHIFRLIEHHEKIKVFRADGRIAFE